jgi:hypothetical protein
MMIELFCLSNILNRRNLINNHYKLHFIYDRILGFLRTYVLIIHLEVFNSLFYPCNTSSYDFIVEISDDIYQFPFLIYLHLNTNLRNLRNLKF